MMLTVSQADVLVNLITCDSHDLSKHGAVSAALLSAAGTHLQQVFFCSVNQCY